MLNAKAKVRKEEDAASANTAIIHTTYGDIHVKLFPSAAPKAIENFVRLSRTNYYNNCIFHRVIRKFMIQTGDAEFGDGTGGKSIWGKEFEDEFSDVLKHDKPYTVSMANAGPGTNASQFFITTERTVCQIRLKGCELLLTLSSPGSMESTRSLDAPFKVWTLYTRLRMLGHSRRSRKRTSKS